MLRSWVGVYFIVSLFGCENVGPCVCAFGFIKAKQFGGLFWATRADSDVADSYEDPSAMQAN